MIKNIFFDLDETLAFMDSSDPKQEHYPFTTEHGETYYAILRPKAKEVIAFARALVGIENVYILTAATKDYACNANRVLDLGFPEAHIFAREDVRAHRAQIGYGYGILPHGTLAYKNNILIDNLPPRENTEKIDFLGMHNWQDTYIKVPDYYGANYSGYDFEEHVCGELTNLCSKLMLDKSTD
jgi:FMN phosphatase YigB (HAD superfamily)